MDIKKVAKLANLPLTLDEEKKFSGQLAKVVDLVSKLQAVDTKGIEPTAQVTGKINILREDEIDSNRGLSQEEALSNAKKTQNGCFVVPKILS